MTIDTIVGKATLKALYDITEQYIKSHTQNGLYVGEVQYLQKYIQLHNELYKK